jgi:hypothetical protein
MIRMRLVLVLTGLLLSPFTLSFAYGQASAGSDAAHVAMIKDAVANVGVGPKARVKLMLWDGEKVQGIVNEIRPDNFIVLRTEENMIGTPLSLAYGDVQTINGKGASSDWAFKGSKSNTGAVASGVVSIFTGIYSCPIWW